MHFHDPSRPRSLTGRPCWPSAPLVVLPHIMLDPLPDGGWMVSVMVWDCAREAGHWGIVRCTEGAELARLLVNWEADPERTLREVFGEQPPDASQTRATSGRVAKQQSIVDSTTATLEELGL